MLLGEMDKVGSWTKAGAEDVDQGDGVGAEDRGAGADEEECAEEGGLDNDDENGRSRPMERGEMERGVRGLNFM